MLKRILGVVIALVIIVVMVFVVINHGNFSSIIPDIMSSSVQVEGELPNTAPLPEMPTDTVQTDSVQAVGQADASAQADVAQEVSDTTKSHQ